MNKTLIVALCAALLLSACGDAGQQHAKDGSHPAAGDAGHGHAPGGEKITHFSERTELFVEFPRLVVGEKSAFAAHLTTVADFRALAVAKVSVILSGGGLPDEVFVNDKPSQPGIFRPEAQPQAAGERELTIEVATPEFTVRHLLGPVTVYADRKAADAEHGEHEEEGIAFTKEQQWKVDFATAEVLQKPLRPVISATGSVRGRPDGEALMLAPAPGRVLAAGPFPVLGQAVKKGELLATFAPSLGGDADLATLQADAKKAAIELDLAQRERARMESLFKEEAVPEKRLLAAQAGEASARANLAAAQGRAGQYGGAGGVPLRAPVAGVLADVRVAPGAYAQEGSALFHIVDRSALWLELRVPEAEAARLATPSGAAFRVDGIGDSFEIVPGRNGRLIAVGAAVDPTTRTLPVLFEMTAPDARLRIGMAVKAQVFAGPAREAVAVPVSAVLDENGIATVFVMIGGESFVRQSVRVGVCDGDWVEVVEGLEPGQRVVSRGAYLVKLAASNTGQIGHGHAH
ncbi:MAG: efflux RND transporter periplasmic adaptor subunit [Candidatus Accumulibacter sp.]|nr:efflux RND transporter periplasmic adaptor subunit [Candidatus Accumulibacter conexus]